MVMTYACIALSDIDKIRLIDFPVYERERLAETIKATYGYGNIQRELPRDEECCLEFKLKVSDILTIISVLLFKWPSCFRDPHGMGEFLENLYFYTY